MLLPDGRNARLKRGRLGPLAMGAGKAAGPPSVVWRPFTLTAGDTGDWIGYTSGDIAYPPFNPPMGLISGEPAAGIELEAMYIDPATMSLVVVLYGNLQAVETIWVTVDDATAEQSSVEVIGLNNWYYFENFPVSFQDGKTYGVIFSSTEPT